MTYANTAMNETIRNTAFLPALCSRMNDLTSLPEPQNPSVYTDFRSSRWSFLKDSPATTTKQHRHWIQRNKGLHKPPVPYPLVWTRPDKNR
ncbi:hypothetical protein Zmor_014994 [Zophobas morio]|uniref:Uncharacterized protein n=1 Tax=Zophobas morio TaxID=2755281 RepID=A0AA38IKK4_9CUCU|nr:hypothetical protein Zmor_014994 [Zophobas morio]